MMSCPSTAVCTKREAVLQYGHHCFFFYFFFIGIRDSYCIVFLCFKPCPDTPPQFTAYTAERRLSLSHSGLLLYLRSSAFLAALSLSMLLAVAVQGFTNTLGQPSIPLVIPFQ